MPAVLYDTNGMWDAHCSLVCADCLQTGDAFTAAADAYVRRFLQKGIPSLFTDLKSLYANAAKAEVCALVDSSRDIHFVLWDRGVLGGERSAGHLFLSPFGPLHSLRPASAGARHAVPAAAGRARGRRRLPAPVGPVRA